MTEHNSIFGSLIYRAIGEPEYWHQNSVDALLKLLTEELSLDEPDTIAQIKMGKELVGKLSEKESLVSAVMSVLDGARYGLFVLDHDYNVLYQNTKVKNHLDHLLDPKQQGVINKELRGLISQQAAGFNGVESTELIRLEYSCCADANLYLRSTLQQNFSNITRKYLHHIMIAEAGDNNQICQQVSKTYGLSEREESIVQSAVKALAAGGSTKEIAEDLFISPNTVKTHLKSIYAKSGVNSLAALVSLYLQHEAQQLTSYFGGASVSEETIEESADKFITLPSTQMLCYREYGDPNGRPLMVLHNSYSSRLNLPPRGNTIAKKVGRRVIIPDRPGYGRSPAHDAYPQQWSEQCKAFLDQLNIEKIDLLANALSVRFALEFAVRYPERVSKLILTTPLLFTLNQDIQYFCDWLRVSIQLYERNPEFATEIYKLWHSSAGLRLDNHIKKNLQLTISTSEKGVMDSSDFLMVLKNNFRESCAQQGRGTSGDFEYCFNKTSMDLSQITSKVDIWVGSEDDLFTPQGVQETFKALPHKAIFEREGYGIHIYYSLFEEIIGSG